jgi:SAM-dependent methyltransferase
MTDDRPWCNVCGHDGDFLAPERGREGLICANCSASTRQRALIYALSTWLGEEGRPVVAWTPRRELRVFETSGRSAYPALLAEKLRYVNAEYRADPRGQLPPFSEHADLERLSYPDASLDIVLVADVFEHVRHDEEAFHEVHRVLTPGSVVLFTVPYEPERAETLIRVRVEDDQDVLLMEPEYHGGGGHTLAYRTYGRDLLRRLRESGFAVGIWELDIPRHAVAHQIVFVGVKGSAIPLNRFHRSSAGATPDRGAMAHPQSVPLLPFRLWTLAKYNLRAARQIMREMRSRLGT